ncbi:MAG: hypothetical protein HYX26_03290 [Acidobacteriales bacterium]|nr:hypothetical protein [Terriglobales bacterium]
MATDERRLEELQVATLLCTFDRNLRASGKGSMIWGAITIAIGLAVLLVSWWGLVNLLLGSALFAEGIYERTARNPMVIRISAITLGVLALWNIGGIALAWLTATRALGHALWLGIAQAIGAYNTWQTFSVYVALRNEAKPAIVEEARRHMDDMVEGDASLHSDIVEFQTKKTFGEEKIFRIKIFSDLLLIGQFESFFDRKRRLESAFWIPRGELQFVPTGEEWMGKKQKGVLHVGAEKIENVRIKPEMVERLQTGGIGISSVRD